MEPLNQKPITVTVVIDGPQGTFSVSKTQQFSSRSNNALSTRRPTQTLSQLWKDALADVNPYIRRHDTVNG